MGDQFWESPPKVLISFTQAPRLGLVSTRKAKLQLVSRLSPSLWYWTAHMQPWDYPAVS